MIKKVLKLTLVELRTMSCTRTIFLFLLFVFYLRGNLLLILKSFYLNHKTPYPSAPVRCALLASPVDKFAEIVSQVPNYASPPNK